MHNNVFVLRYQFLGANYLFIYSNNIVRILFLLIVLSEE
jgi:hypothetical protein